MQLNSVATRPTDMRLKVGLAISLVLASCAAPDPTPVPQRSSSPTRVVQSPPLVASPGSSTIVVRQSAFAGNGFYTEGAEAFIEIYGFDGTLAASARTSEYRLDKELLRTELQAGNYVARSYVRPCQAACPALDAPTASCELSFAAQPGRTVELKITRSIRGCSIDA